MKEVGLLNSDIADVVSRLGHMDELIVCDAGFPLPLGVRVVDIALAENTPTLLDVLGVLLRDLSVERAIVAGETERHNPTRFAAITKMLGDGVIVETMPHTEFKQRSRNVKAIIRTGDFTAYSNVLLISAGGQRWYIETP